MRSKIATGAQVIYIFLCWLILLIVLYQVYLAGLVVVARLASWSAHGEFGFLMFLPLLLMVILVFPARYSRRIKALTWLLFGIYIIQFVAVMLRSIAPYLSAIHPVLALFDFAIGLWLAIRTTELLRERKSTNYKESPNLI